MVDGRLETEVLGKNLATIALIIEVKVTESVYINPLN